MIYWLAGIALTALLSITAFSWYGHVQYKSGYNAATQEQKILISDLKAKQTIVTTHIITKYIPEVQTIYEQGKILIKRVPVYVTKKDTSNCIVNNGFVFLWNAANQGMPVPAAASSVDEETSFVKLNDIAAEHTRESIAYKETEQQLTALQEWIMEQQAISQPSSK